MTADRPDHVHTYASHHAGWLTHDQPPTPEHRHLTDERIEWAPPPVRRMLLAVLDGTPRTATELLDRFDRAYGYRLRRVALGAEMDALEAAGQAVRVVEPGQPTQWFAPERPEPPAEPPADAQVEAVLNVLAPEQPLPPGLGQDSVRVPLIYFEYDGHYVRPEMDDLRGLARQIVTAIRTAVPSENGGN